MTPAPDTKHALVLRAGPWDTTQAVPRTAACLRELGYDVTVLSWDFHGNKPPQERIQGWRVVWFRKPFPPRSIKYFLYWVFWWWWVVRQLLKRPYVVVHAMNLESAVPCVLLRRQRGYKLVYDIRDAWGQAVSNRRFPLPQAFRILDRWAARGADGLLLSQGILDRMGRFFGRAVCERIPAIQVLNVPQRDMAGQFLPPPLEGIRLNFSGHISYLRNAAAIIELARQRPDVRVDVVGPVNDPALRRELEGLPNCLLHGYLSFEKAMELMKPCNLVAVMYDVFTEVAIVSSANKMFEAMMMSRPYIGSAGGFPGLVAEQVGAGWAVPYNDSQALIALVDRLRQDPALIEQAAQRARQAYCQRFQWDVQKANLRTLYAHLLDGQTPRFRQVAGWHRILGTTFDTAQPEPPAAGPSAASAR